MAKQEELELRLYFCELEIELLRLRLDLPERRDKNSGKSQGHDEKGRFRGNSGTGMISGQIQGENGLAKSDKDAIINNKYRLVGAGKNYPIKSPNGGRVKFAPGEKVTKIKAILGKGTGTPLRDSAFLQSSTRIDAAEWSKMRGNAFIIEKGKKKQVEIHWYEAKNTITEIKVKRYFDEG